MGTRSFPERFLVAFSLAGEQRELVRAIALEVERRLGPSTVFLDEWFEHYVAGDDGDLVLQGIYRTSVLAVVCISGQYHAGSWTRAEYRAIRARYLDSQATPGTRFTILMVRVGDGEPDAVFANAIVPDLRDRPVVESAQLIIDRLGIVARDEVEVPSQLAADGPAPSRPLRWPVADHADVRHLFAELLAAAPAFRILPVRGPSETGKSHVSRQMLADARMVPSLSCGRFDFRGWTDLDGEIDGFACALDVARPAAATPAGALAAIHDELRRRRRPTLLVFDTFEAATDAGAWIERDLLPSVTDDEWLRVVVLGQKVPARHGAVWGPVAAETVTLAPPGAGDWWDYAQGCRPDDARLTREFVQQMYSMVDGRAGLLASVLGVRG